MILEVNRLKKSFGSKHVLNGIDLRIPDASVYGLVGKNGAGKTTFLNILAGISDADSGECIISGEKIRRGHYSSGLISYLPDLPSFFDYLTVREYISFILSACNSKHNGKYDFGKKLDEIGLDERARIKSLSRGNRQKLGILASVITEPKLLILDEPTSALDPVGRREVMLLIQDLRKQGITILFSTHILSDLESVCNKIGFLHEGIIQREVDMNADNNLNAYEITFRGSSTDCVSKICKHMPEYHVEVAAQSNKLICTPKDGNIDQERFFTAISHIDAEIHSIKRVSKNDLEVIMLEVLSK